MLSHQHYMSRCLHLAAMGLGAVAPNPMVGAVLVFQGRIIAEGYHHRYGAPHAEVNCINNVKPEDLQLLPQATLYVNLEPCSHYGKTPPCADFIIDKKIGSVIIGSTDPNPQVAGMGIAKLKAAGIEIIGNVLEQDCDFLNRRFLTYHKKKRPYIILKWAQSADGFIAPTDKTQLWLTNEFAQQRVHQWRTQEQAILVGTNTTLIDNPKLTARLWQGTQPTRLIIDLDLKVPTTHHIYNDEAKTIVYNLLKNETIGNIIYQKVASPPTLLTNIIADLYSREIQSVIVEGGAFTLQQFIDAGLCDEARVFTASKTIINGIKAPPINNSKLISEENIKDDQLKIYLTATK